MTLVEAIFLGVVQGVTEFLPVSSTGHLVLAKHQFGLTNTLAFDVALHGGTLLAVLIYFRNDLRVLLMAGVAGLKRPAFLSVPSQRMIGMLIVGTIPAGVLGLLFDDWVEANLRAPAVVAGALIAVGVLIMGIERVAKPERRLEVMGYRDAIVIGLCQAMALVPGVSRSGATIAAALALGLMRPAAVRFSFLLGIPVIGGGVLLKGKDLLDAGLSQGDASVLGAGILAAFVSGYACIGWLLAFVKTRTFTPFMLYRIALGIAVFALLAV